MGTIVNKLSYLNETKNLIKSALRNKGLDITDDMSFRSYADVLNNASLGGNGGVELNIAYGDTAPEDTGKLWVKTDEPNNVVINLDNKNEHQLDYWVESIPISAADIAVASVGTKIYLFGGTNIRYTSGESSYITRYNNIFIFDTENNTIDTIETSLVDVAGNMSTATVGTDIYLFGGGGMSPYRYYSEIYKFDTNTNVLSKITDFPNSNYYAELATVAVGENIYIFGGSRRTSTLYGNKPSPSTGIHIFNINSATISTLSTTLPVATSDISAAVVDTKIYLFGGKTEDGTRLDTIYIFDTTTNTLTVSNTVLPSVAAGLCAITLGTRIYLFGGYAASDTIMIFNTDDESINILDVTLPSSVCRIGATRVKNGIYMFGGCDKNRDSSGNTSGNFSNIINVLNVSSILSYGTLSIQTTSAGNTHMLLEAPTVSLRIGIAATYIGNPEGYAEKVPAYLYKDGAWNEI